MDVRDEDEEIEAPPADPEPLDDALRVELAHVPVADDPALISAVAEAAQLERERIEPSAAAAVVAAARVCAPLRDVLLDTGMPFAILSASPCMEQEETVLLSGEQYRACSVSPLFVHLMDVVFAGLALKEEHEDYQVMDKRTLLAALVMVRADDAHTLLPRRPPGAGGKMTLDVRVRCADYVEESPHSLIICLDATDDAHIWTWAGKSAPFDWLMIHGICASVFPLPSEARTKLDRAAIWAAIPKPDENQHEFSTLKRKFESLFNELAQL